ncbi:MAG: HAD family phosphatase [Bryobacteraceae bacterium]
MGNAAGTPKPYDAILFDFDGVLADTEPLHYECWAEALGPLGISLDWETFRAHGVGLTDLALIEFLAAQSPAKIELDAIRSKVQEKKRLFIEKAATRSAVTAQTCEIVKTLNSYKMAVVTSSSRLEVEPLLNRAGILGSFSAMVFGKEAGRPKPAPDPYLLAASRLEAKSALVVEDSEAGLASGRAAGFDVLHIPHPDLLPELLTAALGLAKNGKNPGCVRQPAL